MTSRRPQDPRTKKIRDDQADLATMAPNDVGATVMPDDGSAPTAASGPGKKPHDPQRNIETADPSATVAPKHIEPPKPRSAQQAMTPAAMEAMRAEVRAKAAAQEAALSQKKKKRGASWLVWVVAFLLLGGIGFGVAWFVMNPPGGGEVASGDAGAAPAEDAAGDDAAAAAGDAGDAGAADKDTAAAAAADAGAAGDAAAAGDAGAAGDAAAAAGDAGAAGDAAAAAGDAAGAGDTAAAAADTALPAVDTAVAAADTGAAATDDTALPPVDTAPAPADTAVAVAPDGAEPPATPDAAAPEPARVVLVKNPLEATRLNEDGLAARKKGDHQAALKFYEQALTADPDHVWARYNYACELALTGRDKDALAELTKLYKLGTADAKKALAAARKDSDFNAIKESGQFFRLTNF